MTRLNTSLAFLILVFLGVAWGQAGFKPEEFTSEKWLSAHNLYREQHCTPDLVWNESLAEIGQEWSDKCEFASDSMSPYGQNVWKGLGSFLGFFNASRAVDSWYSQVSNYDFSAPAYNANVGAMTQVLWKSSTQLGCGATVCDEERAGIKSVLVACYYSPPGNLASALQENVLPPCDAGEQVLSKVETRSQPQDTTQASPVTPSNDPIEIEEPQPVAAIDAPAPKDIGSLISTSMNDESEDWVLAHNVKREAHCVPDVEWNQTLAEAAETIAKDCEFVSTYPIDNVGSNQFTSLGTEVDPDMIVNEWYSELAKYDFEAATWSSASGSFTQLVWKDTTSIGCAIGRACCPDFGDSGECPDAKRYAICLYSPPGNFFGQFGENVLPLCTDG